MDSMSYTSNPFLIMRNMPNLKSTAYPYKNGNLNCLSLNPPSLGDGAIECLSNVSHVLQKYAVQFEFACQILE